MASTMTLNVPLNRVEGDLELKVELEDGVDGLVHVSQLATKRINKPGTIRVAYENLRVSVDGDKAAAKFRQGSRKTSMPAR